MYTGCIVHAGNGSLRQGLLGFMSFMVHAANNRHRAGYSVRVPLHPCRTWSATRAGPLNVCMGGGQPGPQSSSLHRGAGATQRRHPDAARPSLQVRDTGVPASMGCRWFISWLK